MGIRSSRLAGFSFLTAIPLAAVALLPAAAGADVTIAPVPTGTGTTLTRARTDDTSTATPPERALRPATPKPKQADLIPIETWVHVVARGQAVNQGNVPDAAIAAQLQVLNASFNPHGFKFVFKGTDRTFNAAWAPMKVGSLEERTAKEQLHKGTATTLNLYLADLGQGQLEYAKGPWEYAASPSQDGITLLYTALPGGSAAPYNLGKQAVHSVGHWLGLFHTFQGGCSTEGDRIGDTPAEKTPAFGCPVGRNSCANRPGNDPIDNFMDYTDDACINKFTAGQAARMLDLWQEYREGK